MHPQPRILPLKPNNPVWLNDQRMKDAPNHAEAEAALLGCILSAGLLGTGRVTLERVASRLRYDDFYQWRHGLLYRAMEHLYLAGREIDLLAIESELNGREINGKKLLEWIGGRDYLLRLSGSTAVNIEEHAHLILDCALRRSTLEAAAQIQRIAAQQTLSPLDRAIAVEQATRDLLLRSSNISSGETECLFDALDSFEKRVLDESEQEDYAPGVPTGFYGLDRITLGWRRNKLYFIAAPNGWGKTVFVLSSVLQMVKGGYPALFITLEMPVEDLTERLVAMHGSLNYTHLQARKLAATTVARPLRELQAFEASRQMILTRLKRPTMRQIKGKIEEGLKQGVQAVFIDYIIASKIDPTGLQNVRDEFSHASAIYAELEHMKEIYGVPLIVTTQMNRDWTHRKGGKPKAGDLYYGNMAENAADFIGYIYNPALAGLKDAQPDEAELLVRKNRSGQLSSDTTINLIWEPEYVRFCTGDPESRQIDLL